MTIGQRVAQKRKELGLSQEALGDQLGVSRQSIYKWESDSALPEIDKLIALSRLFGVSVGWLLGVEEPLRTDGTDNGDAPETEPGELTEAQLRMVEEIVARYTAAVPQPKRRRWPFVLAGLVLTVVFLNLFQSLDTLRLQQQSIFNDISRVESSVNTQIGSISIQVEDILKAQNSLIADYGSEILSADLKKNEVTFSLRAVPKTYTDGMQVEFLAESGGSVGTIPGEAASNGGYTASLTCPLSDSITLSVVLILPDGTRSTQLLDQFDGLYSVSLPAVEMMDYGSGDLLGLEADADGLVTLPEVYVTTQPDLLSADTVKEPIGRSEAETVRVGLFRNQSLITWLEPCERPESFHGDYENHTFYHLPEGTQAVLTGDSDQIQFAAVVTDQYGREVIYGDVPYVLSADGELTWPDTADLSNHDPSNWQY